MTGEGSKKKTLISLTNKLSFIDRTINTDDVQVFLDETEHKKNEEKNNNENKIGGSSSSSNMLEHLGQTLDKVFGKRICNVIGLPKGFEWNYLPVGRPHVYVIDNPELILDGVLKLFISQNQQPTASRVIFCDESTTVEHIECLLRRACIKPQQQLQGKSILHCLVQPEKLRLGIIDNIISMMPKYMYQNGCLLAVVTSNKTNRIYEQLMSFYRVRQAWIERERIMFFESILETDLNRFHEKQNENPLCAVFLSQRECVGKSFIIGKEAKKHDHKLCHIPINTKTVDVDFVVDRLLSANKEMNNDENDKDSRIIYHINVSSDAGIDVNTVMFELLVLRYLTKSSGESFNVTNKHGFFVEFPSKLSRLVNTNIKDVQTQFSFLAGSRSKGIKKFEVEDSF